MVWEQVAVELRKLDNLLLAAPLEQAAQAANGLLAQAPITQAAEAAALTQGT